MSVKDEEFKTKIYDLMNGSYNLEEYPVAESSLVKDEFAEGEYCENKSIGEYEKKLDPEQFFRIHKSIIINLDKVREVFPWGSNSFSLRMRGYEDKILPIARDKTRILKQHLMGL